uniref:Uncharacterized protein n=1 Tax=Aegilops tauschii subsp. strangulata TaxID=200361 RepID=A0A453GN77_AEGTS
MSYVDIILFFVLLLSSHWNNAFLSIYKVQPCGSGHDAKDTDGLGLHTMQVYLRSLRFAMLMLEVPKLLFS